MSRVYASSRMPRRQPSKQLLDELGNSIEHRASPPTSVVVDGIPVHIDDLSLPIARFGAQFHDLLNEGLTWPCARFIQRDMFSEDDDDEGMAPLVIRWVPIDLTAGSASGTVSERVVDQAEARIANLGLGSVRRPLSDVFRTFRARLAEDIMSRWLVENQPSMSQFGNDDPVEVTTDSDRLNVLFSVGPFLSTQQGFGLSSPAKRQLRPGSYCFGVARPFGEPYFSEIIWNVPESMHMHLAV